MKRTRGLVTINCQLFKISTPHDLNFKITFKHEGDEVEHYKLTP